MVNKRISIVFLMAVLLVIVGCGTDDGGAAAPSSPTALISTPTAASVELPPVPSVAIFVGDIGYRGNLFRYCWPDKDMPEEAVAVCADPFPGVFGGEEVAVADGKKLRIVVDSVSPPTRLTASIYADPNMPAIEQINISNEAARTLDVDSVGRGNLYLRIHGEVFTAECMYAEAEPLPITYDVLAEETPTEFDGRNSADCTFSKPVKLINVTLRSGQGSVHNQSFRFEEPRVEIGFPLSDWDESVSTLELLAPGPYTRTMTAISDAEEIWVITDHVDAALDEVTVVESAPPTPLPVQEWEVEDVSVDGSTVTVNVRVFATADLDVLIDGTEPDEVIPELPLLRYVFHDVSSGIHELSIFDVVGHDQGQPIVVP